jgi:hypothetical protein
MSYLSRACASTAAAAAVVVSVAAPAVADTTTFTDQRGDAVARYDLTRTAISNGKDRVVVVQSVRALRGGRTQIFAVNLSARGEHYVLHTIRAKTGAVRYRFSGGPGDDSVECSIRARWKLAADSIRVSVPRDCVAAAGTLRVSTATGAGNGSSGDPADWTKTVRVGQD